MKRIKLTGRYYHKQTWFGLVLMVEWEMERQNITAHLLKWKKATGADLVTLEGKFNKITK